MTYLELIELIDAKDRRGWENLYLQYGQKFYGFAVTKWSFNEDEAWNIVYQTLETIILKIGDYKIESQAHFDNLVFKIFTNFLRQEYRRLKKIAEEFQVLSYGEMDIAAADGSEKEANEESLKIPFDKEFFRDYFEIEDTESPKIVELKKALNKLDPFEKDLLLLKANNFSYDEIAKMLKVDNNQLKVKHHRAKNKLIKLLQTI